MYVDDVLMLHTRNCNIRKVWALWYGEKYDYTDFGTDIGEFISIHVVQGPGYVTIDSERYIEI